MKILIIFFLNFQLLAGPFQIINRTYGNVPAAQQSEIDAIFNSVEVSVNASLPDADQSTYLKGMANATAISSKGLGVDYATHPDLFIFGYAVGVGADVGNNSFADLLSGDVDGNQVRGFGVATSLMAGIRPGVFWKALDRVTLFINQASQDLPDTTDGLTGEFSTFGMHIQYNLVKEVGTKYLFKWGGIDITAGMESTSMKITYLKVYNTSQTTTLSTLGNPQVTANFAGTAIAGADIDILSFPLEISTHFTVLYALTMFGGLSADFNSGEAKSLASLSGPITVTDTLDAIGTVTAEPSLDLGQSDGPTSVYMRYFVGFQFNIPFVKLYTQLNHGIGQDTWGLNFGVRLAY